MVTSLSNASKDQRACLAKAQRALATQFFGNGFSDNVNEYVLYPTYEPIHDNKETDSPNEGWAFSMFEGANQQNLILPITSHSPQLESCSMP